MSLVVTIMLGSHLPGVVLHTVLPGESPNECIVYVVMVWKKGDKPEVSEIRLDCPPVRRVSCGIAIAIAAHAAPSAFMLAAAIFP